MDYRVLKCWKPRKSRWQETIFIKYLKGTDFLIFEETFKNKRIEQMKIISVENIQIIKIKRIAKYIQQM